jgi:hypothetical protein
VPELNSGLQTPCPLRSPIRRPHLPSPSGGISAAIGLRSIHRAAGRRWKKIQNLLRFVCVWWRHFLHRIEKSSESLHWELFSRIRCNIHRAGFPIASCCVQAGNRRAVSVEPPRKDGKEGTAERGKSMLKRACVKANRLPHTSSSVFYLKDNSPRSTSPKGFWGRFTAVSLNFYCSCKSKRHATSRKWPTTCNNSGAEELNANVDCYTEPHLIDRCDRDSHKTGAAIFFDGSTFSSLALKRVPVAVGTSVR